MMVPTQTSGDVLEARVQRLFLAQGLFAERRLVPAATVDRRMLATDVDVLVSEYASGFHLTRLHAECKGGKAPLLDRILWLSGLRRLLGADGSYLVGDLDVDASEFARGLDVQLLTLRHLEAWEKSLGIPIDAWPCRSDLDLYERARDRWQKLSGDKDADETWRFLRDALAFIEIESWLSFRYRHLNKAFRLLETLVARCGKDAWSVEQDLCGRYVFSGMLVRLSQHLLGACFDVATVLPSDTKRYLLDRLTFGDHDAGYVSGLIRGTLEWVGRAIRERGSSLPASADVSRLYAPPGYSEDFIQLIDRLILQGNDARHLPVAMEVREFGHGDVEQKFPRLRAASVAGDGLMALVKAFIVRAFSVPEKLAKPIGGALSMEGREGEGAQLGLKADG